jgi:hypothetical protein
MLNLALRPVSLVVALSLATAACSTTYVPVAGPLASIVLDGGKPAISREGKVYSIGAFGGGLEDAVAGNPKAEEHARAYNTDLTIGFACTMLSIAAMVGGGTITAVQATENSGSASIPGLGLLAAAVALYVTGITFLASAPPHLYDALNIYNDGVDHLRPSEDAAKAALPHTLAPAPRPSGASGGWSFSPTAGASER